MPLPKGGVYTVDEACRLTGLDKKVLKLKLPGKGFFKTGKGLHFRVEDVTPLIAEKKIKDETKRLKENQGR